jgi:outer membrane protein TolC
MRLHHLIRRARIGTIAAMFAAIPMSVFAQNGQSPFSISLQQASAQAASQLQSESVRRLSIDEAVTLALEQNLGIRIQRFDPQIQDTGVAQARSFWAPSLTSNFSKNGQTQQPTSSLSGGATSILNSNLNTAVGLNQQLPWGAVYSATWNSSRFTTTNLFQGFSPRRLEPTRTRSR